METKNLVEQLREMVELSIESNQYPPVYADAIIGHLCVSMSDEQELFTIIADRIEREYMPLPMLEGEPLKVGDKVDGYGQEGAEVVAVMNSVMVVVRSTVKGGHGYHDGAYPLLLWDVSELKRHKPDTLERIEADAMKAFNDYWGCGHAECSCCPVMVDGKKPYERYECNTSCMIAQKLDLLRRQRDVLERWQE